MPKLSSVNKAESVYKALASSHRLRILSLIVESEDICAKEIASQMGLSQPDISYHLSRLHKVGILSREKQGTRHCYQLNRKTLESAGIQPNILTSFRR